MIWSPRMHQPATRFTSASHVVRDRSGAASIGVLIALVILAALFPVTLSISLLRVWLFPDLGLLPSVLIGNILGIIVLTWVLMPPLTRALGGWLRS